MSEQPTGSDDWKVTIDLWLEGTTNDALLVGLGEALAEYGAAWAGHGRDVSVILTVNAPTAAQAVASGTALALEAIAAAGREVDHVIAGEAVIDHEADDG